jgi:outer membrane protein insertion porin family
MRRWPAALLIAGYAVLAAGTTGARAADDGILVAGNKRIPADTIRSYFHARTKDGFDAGDLDAGLKALYATGLFADARISRRDGHVLITVAENPAIGHIAFEGNSKLKADDLKKIVQSKEGGPLSRASVQADVARIVDLYHHRGRFDVRVDPKIIEAKDHRVDLVFAIQEGARTGVRQTVFVGNKAYSASDLRGVIKTGQTNILSPLLDNDLYDPDRVEADRDLLRRFYRARGYADIRVVSADAQYDPDKKGFVVTFTLDEGPRYKIGTVDVSSDIASVEAGPLRANLAPRPGDIYNADLIEKTVARLTTRIASRGAPFATVRVQSERRGDRGSIDLRYVVEPGPRVYVERIEIHGNTKTRDDIIRREFDFAEGDAYDAALVTRAERHLKNLGYFKSVNITRQPGSTADRVIVNVAVEEQETGIFTVAGGYSTVDGLIGEVSIGERNFLGRGELVKASVSYGQYTEGFDLALVEPHILDSRASLGAELFAKNSTSSTYQSYDSTSYGGKVTLGLPLTDQFSTQWSYSLYRQALTLDPAMGTASLPIQQAAAAGPMWISSIGAGVTYSTLDNNRSPTSGWRSSINEEFAGLGGDAKFAKTTEDLRYYQPLADGIVGMVRAQSGYVAPWGGQPLPLADGFFGGPQLVRGFAPNGFGPRDITPGTTMDNVGGNIYWATSAELQTPVPFVPPDAGLKAAFFADAGSLWNTRSASAAPALSQSLIANSRAIRSSVGAGLVWDSLLGPIRIDYAYPTTQGAYDVTQRLHFSAGGF